MVIFLLGIILFIILYVSDLYISNYMLKRSMLRYKNNPQDINIEKLSYGQEKLSYGQKKLEYTLVFIMVVVLINTVLEIFL